MEEKTNYKSNGPFILSTSCEILADLETPVSTFYKVCSDKPYSFLLESVEGNEKIGRYSLIGTEPILIFKNTNNQTSLENIKENLNIQLEDNPFIALKNLLKNIEVITTDGKTQYPFLGFIGYFGYETVRWIEPKIKLAPFNKTPDVCLIFPGKLVIFDHILHKVILIINSLIENKHNSNQVQTQSNQRLEEFIKEFKKPVLHEPLSLKYENNTDIKYKSNYKKENFIEIINKAKEYITNGDIFQVVLSQKLSLQGRGNYNGFLLYRALRSINPSPYLFYLNFQGKEKFEMAGSSPEVMVKCEKKGKDTIASLRPIAGTYPRGKDEREDLENIQKLSSDPKERAEHVMLVDLARNDLGRVCESGTITVPERMIIEKYSHVLHMVSQVEGVLKKDKTSIDLLTASFPAGTLSGAPKVRAMEIINELEKDARGPYGGCVGFFGLNDLINTAMTIRTFLIYSNNIEIQAGAGIVADSNPENEYKETIRKGAALLKAVSLLS